MELRPVQVGAAEPDQAVAPLIRYLYLRYFAGEIAVERELGNLPADFTFLRGQEQIEPTRSTRQTLFNERVHLELPAGEELRRVELLPIDRGWGHVTLFLHEGYIYADLDLRPVLRLTNHPMRCGCSESFLVRIEALGSEINEQCIPKTGGVSLVVPPYHLSKGIEKVLSHGPLFLAPLVTARTLKEKLRITYSQIRVWEDLKYVRPAREGSQEWRRFSLLDLVSYSMLREIRDMGLGLKRAEKILKEIAHWRVAMGAVLLHLENRPVYLATDFKEYWAITHDENVGTITREWVRETGKPVTVLPLSDIIDTALVTMRLSVEGLKVLTQV